MCCYMVGLMCLRGGTIYDIKRIFKYTPHKYLNSYQHGFYLDLFDRAKEFKYLAYDGLNLHIETYYRGDYIPTIEVVDKFYSWLKDNDLLSLYKSKWETRKD